ncbi:MAG TPA: peptidyl-prolyl cis-trans isomerase, partial [bacterium]|nr:peptidyl-prolyl cis-trans isomerase [bacterium]
RPMSDRRSRLTPFWSGFVAGGLVLGALAGSLAIAATTLYGPQVAKVNGTVITESQLLWYLYSTSSEDVVKDLVFNAIVAAEGPKMGITIDPAEADKVLERYHQDRVDEVGAAINLGEVKQAILRQITAGEVMNAKRAALAKDPKYAVTDEEIGEAYIRNAELWAVPEKVGLSVISTKSLKQAEAALAALKGGTQFAEAARQFSEDETTKESGGKIGRPIPKGVFFKPAMKKVEAAAFSLPVGKFSEIIQVADNFFIIQVDEKIPAREVSIDEARDFLREELEEAKVAQPMRDWLQSLGAKAELEVVYPIFTTSAQDLRTLDLPKDEKDKNAKPEGTPAPPAG